MAEDWFDQTASKASTTPTNTDWFAQRDPVQQKGFLESAADASGLSAVIHPIDAIMGIPGAVKQAGANIADAYSAVRKDGITPDTRRALGRAIPILGPALAEAQSQQDAGNTGGAVGTLLGTVAGLAGPKALKEVGGSAPAIAAEATAKTAKTMQSIGESAEAAGNKVVNETVGSYKADFKRGANPGRGYNSTGQGISLTMRSLADKAESAKSQVGSQIQKVINASGAKDALIPINDVFDAIGKPLKEAHDAETSPGGLGNTSPFEKYAEQFKPILSEGFKRGGFTAQEVFELKKQIAAKAKFSNTTPEGIMDVRQSQVGALGGLLKSVIPDLAPLNQAYQDLVKLADRATWRSESGSMSLGRMVGHGAKGLAAVAAGAGGGAEAGLGVAGALSALDSTAGRTAIATGLYRGGKAISSAGSRLDEWLRSKR